MSPKSITILNLHVLIKKMTLISVFSIDITNHSILRMEVVMFLLNQWMQMYLGWSMDIALVGRRGNSSKLELIAYKCTHITKSTFLASTFCKWSKLLYIYLSITGLSNSYILPGFRMKRLPFKIWEMIPFYDINNYWSFK